MTDNTDWDAERLGSFVDDVERRGVAPLEELPPEDRAHLARAFRRHAGTVQKRSSTSWREGAVVVLGAHLDAPAALLLSLLSYSAACGIHPRGALRAFTAPLGGARAEALVAGVLRRRSSQYAYAPLIDELVIAYDLPLPTEPRFWEAWADHQRCDPEPGRRWSEHFLALCAVPDALGIVTDDDADWRRRGERLEALDAVEPLDRRQLLRALLTVVDRGDYRTAQRNAIRWIRICGAEDLLWDERRRVLEALPSAEGPFVKLAVTRLLAGGPDGSALSEEELTRIALTVLARKEKMLRRTVLKALKELSAPSLELRETVSPPTPTPRPPGPPPRWRPGGASRRRRSSSACGRSRPRPARSRCPTWTPRTWSWTTPPWTSSWAFFRRTSAACRTTRRSLSHTFWRPPTPGGWGQCAGRQAQASSTPRRTPCSARCCTRWGAGGRRSGPCTWSRRHP